MLYKKWPGKEKVSMEDQWEIGKVNNGAQEEAMDNIRSNRETSARCWCVTSSVISINNECNKKPYITHIIYWRYFIVCYS